MLGRLLLFFAADEVENAGVITTGRRTCCGGTGMILPGVTGLCGDLGCPSFKSCERVKGTYQVLREGQRDDMLTFVLRSGPGGRKETSTGKLYHEYNALSYLVES